MLELVAQRITGHVEPHFISDDMLRGMNDESEARALYAKHHAPVDECGFITRRFEFKDLSFTLGCSPDGLVGADGMIEIKSRRHKYQVETILSGRLPDEYAAQVHMALLVSGRRWCDFISYSGGLPLFVLRVEADEERMDKLMDAICAAEFEMQRMAGEFRIKTRTMLPTVRQVEEEMMV
jgi:predicted phage-related endonuclease